MTNLVTVLDGGMGRELERIGAPFKQPEWSALALMESPDCVAQAHQSFVNAGAEVITTNAYAVIPFHIGQQKFDEAGESLIRLSAEIARDVADNSSNNVQVAGCLPPLFGSYQPEAFCGDKAPTMYETFIRAQVNNVDLWLAETMSCIAEAEAAIKVLAEIRKANSKPLWVSFSVADKFSDGKTYLRSGEPLADAINRVAPYCEAVLFNCSQPESIAVALRQALSLSVRGDLRFGGYANAFAEEPDGNETISSLRNELGPSQYVEVAGEWLTAGATIIGGCCGITPAHIEQLSGAIRA